jgi:hypothetical protein
VYRPANRRPIFQSKGDGKIRLLLIANGVAGLGFLIGNAAGIFAADILASFIWGVLFPIAALLIAGNFRKASND